MVALSVFPKDTTACYVQCGHQIYITITIQRSNRLSHAAAKAVFKIEEQAIIWCAIFNFI